MSEHLNRKTTPIMMRNYGRILQDLVQHACEMPEGEDKDMLVRYVAQCMRQKNAVWNKDQESGLRRIVEDLNKLSKGEINVDVQALEAQIGALPVQQVGKKKNN